jgi:hypothetical protein
VCTGEVADDPLASPKFQVDDVAPELVFEKNIGLPTHALLIELNAAVTEPALIVTKPYEVSASQGLVAISIIWYVPGEV